MVNRVLRIIFALFCIAGLFYLSLPNFSFPKPPPDALQSKEPADTENVVIRRAYFTNYTRAEVLDWYRNEFKKSSFLGIPLPTYLLNYPPENAQTIIRDQTRSTFLQEVIHPFRESVYINGFEPKDAKDTIIIDNKNWRQKITIRFVSSPTWLRIGVFIATMALMIVLYNAWDKSLSHKKE